MSLSQSNPPGYVSSLYPSTPSQYQNTILPETRDASLGGNSYAYNSKQVGGARKGKAKGSKRRGSRQKRTARKMRSSCWGGRNRRLRRTVNRR